MNETRPQEFMEEVKAHAAEAEAAGTMGEPLLLRGQQLLVALMLHCADLSSPILDPGLELFVTDRIFAEFKIQARRRARSCSRAGGSGVGPGTSAERPSDRRRS